MSKNKSREAKITKTPKGYTFIKVNAPNSYSEYKPETIVVVPISECVQQKLYRGYKYAKSPNLYALVGILKKTNQKRIYAFLEKNNELAAGGPVDPSAPSHNDSGTGVSGKGIGCKVNNGKQIEIEGGEYHLGNDVTSDTTVYIRHGTPVQIFEKMVSEKGEPQTITENNCKLCIGDIIITKPAVLAKDKLTAKGTNTQIASCINANYGGIDFTPGGKLFKAKTPKEIAKKYNISEEKAEELIRDGMIIEAEHSENVEVQRAISSHHIEEDENYYQKLKEAGLKCGGKAECGCSVNAEDAAKGALINKRTKFPKTYRNQAGKYGIEEKSEKTHYQINKEIEALIDEKGESSENYTFEEKETLRLYSGYGGVFSEEMTTEQIKGSFTEYYTPDLIVQKMWALAFKYGYENGPILEPSVGTGNFIKYVPSQASAVGYEINKYSCIIAKILYPQYQFINAPFESIFIKNRDSIKNKISELRKYDLVIGNPPYGDVGGIYMGMGEKQYTGAKNWIEYFITRGLDLLNPKGLLIYIIGCEVANGGIPWLQQGNNKVKQIIAEKAELVDAYRLPNGVFDRTDVLTDIIILRKYE